VATRLDTAQVCLTSPPETSSVVEGRRADFAFRWPLLRHEQQQRQLCAAGVYETQPVRYPHRTPHRRLPHPHLLLPGMRRALPLAISLSALPPWSPHPDHSNLTCYTSGFPGGYPPFRPAYAMGRLDRARSSRPHHRLQRRHMRNAPNSRQPEGAQKAHCGECRHERHHLLRKHAPEPPDGRRATESGQPTSDERRNGGG